MCARFDRLTPPSLPSDDPVGSPLRRTLAIQVNTSPSPASGHSTPTQVSMAECSRWRCARRALRVRSREPRVRARDANVLLGDSRACVGAMGRVERGRSGKHCPWPQTHTHTTTALRRACVWEPQSACVLHHRRTAIGVDLVAILIWFCFTVGAILMCTGCIAHGGQLGFPLLRAARTGP